MMPVINTPAEEVHPSSILGIVKDSKIILTIITIAIIGAALGSYTYYRKNNLQKDNKTKTMTQENNTANQEDENSTVEETTVVPETTTSENSNTHYINEIDVEGLTSEEKDVVFEKLSLFRKRHALEITASDDDLHAQATSMLKEILIEMQEKKFGEDEYKEFLRRYLAILKQNNVTPLTDKEILAILEARRVFEKNLPNRKEHPEAFEGTQETIKKLELQRIFGSQYEMYTLVYHTVHGY